MKKSSVLLLILMAASLGIIFSQVANFSQDTTFATAMSKPGKSFQIVGVLDTTKPMEYNPLVNANHFSFYVKDKEGKTSKIVFKGTKPMDFERSESVTLTGTYGDGHFQCSKILTKCPSKYKNDKEFVATTS
jgi:cytochrome c-type biogenesis protein CcmE